MLSENGAVPSPDPQSPMVRAAQRLTTRIETLVTEVAKLRADNISLHQEIRDATAFLLANAPAAQPRKRSTHLVGRVRVRRTKVHAHKPRVTPAEVTPDVVRAVLVKLGESTASEIAAEINKARSQISNGTRGQAVSGRAIRFLAESAGAVASKGESGQRRYSLY